MIKINKIFLSEEITKINSIKQVLTNLDGPSIIRAHLSKGKTKGELEEYYRNTFNRAKKNADEE